jgi:hypothetical protein
MNTKMNNHGGNRNGAGRPALYDQAMDRYNVNLDPYTVKVLRGLSEKGNLSEGIRLAAQKIGIQVPLFLTELREE